MGTTYGPRESSPVEDSRREPPTPTSRDECIDQLIYILNRIRGTEFSRLGLDAVKERVGLLEYLVTPKSGWTEPARAPPQFHPCSVCRETPTSAYLVGDTWLCQHHLPRHLVFPIGLHGAAYVKWKKGMDDSGTPTDAKTS